MVMYLNPKAMVGDPNAIRNAAQIVAEKKDAQIKALTEAIQRTINIYEDEAPIMATDLKAVLADVHGDDN
ncbi:hypothetical protein [Pseudodesulfovibrio sp. JC047]|uniref:hypothetical protein n=1 Tax=Pseudodesulfovibrio sp. JC047 TaxID=2683199 RepID=UPI0013D3B3AF|nr:hypothetical protein [Pseudodesulfovibrio sp. JC047]